MVGSLARALALLLLFSTSGLGQDITNHSVPVGGGPGAVGWKSVGPCQGTLIWPSSNADPVCSSGSSPQTGVQLYVNNATGSDTNNSCLVLANPCQTLTQATNQCNIGMACTINVGIGTGTYTFTNCTYGINCPAGQEPPINIFYFHVVNIVGDCTNNNNVTLNLAGNNLTLFTVQDHALSQINCFRIITNGTGNTILNTRQIAITDFNHINVDASGGGGFSGGTFMSAVENASANCTLDITFTGNVGFTVVFGASKGAIVTPICPVNLTAPNSITYWFDIGSRGLIQAQGQVVTNPGNSSGIQCIVADGSLYKPSGTIPGGANTCTAFQNGSIF